MYDVTQVRVRVHRWGDDPERDSQLEMATIDVATGKLYVRDAGRWWMLSNGLSGWHSLNVGMPDGFEPNGGAS